MFYVYIVQSLKDKRYYIGHTKNLKKRIEEHSRGKSKAVRYRGPFELIYKEMYQTKNEAFYRERQIKSYKGGEAFKKLLSRALTPSSSMV
ncbi:MAG TPA: GIY-YIG nuclease family protein [Candidatus Omnitrophica bacterium]|nr:GIY-YIG nuclease family protein [Candidatus Omnitrophota bacterium]